MTLAIDPVHNLHTLQRDVATAAAIAGRDESAPAIITAVSKKHDAVRIMPVLQAGHTCYGENRVQEAMKKWPTLREQYPNIELRLIGPLQSNKAREAVGLFDVIETVDRPKVARALADEISKQGKAPTLFVQVNTGEEPQKAGITPQETDNFIKSCREDYGLNVQGLMCIPPAGAIPGPHFALLAKLAARNGLTGLSMGMSGDYLDAVKLGATHIRVGTRIFGPRAA